MVDNLMNSWKKSVCNVVRYEQNENDNIINMPDDFVAVNYLTYIRKCIFYPVTVHESNEIKNMISNEIKGPYNTIKKRLSSGDGVSPYLSTEASKLTFDGLYLDWNILHLHLGNLSADSCRAERTGKTLHLMVIKDHAFLIQIGQHGSGAYTDLNEFKIIYNNWPNLLTFLKVTPDQNITSGDRIKARNGGVNYLTTFPDPDNKENLITAAPRQSLGYSTAKTSNYDLKLLDLKIPGLIKSVVEKAKEKSQNSELFSKGQFYYYPQETCFKFGIIDSQENLRPLFEFSSTDLWKNIFSNSTEIKIIVFL